MAEKLHLQSQALQQISPPIHSVLEFDFVYTISSSKDTGENIPPT